MLAVFLVCAQVELIITVVLSPQTSDNELSKSRTVSLQGQSSRYNMNSLYSIVRAINHARCGIELSCKEERVDPYSLGLLLLIKKL